jgi:very-short-patch-repair endonuclease
MNKKLILIFYWVFCAVLNVRGCKSSSHKYFFVCSKEHPLFSMTLANITNGCWCPYCVNKTETKLFEKLLQSYPHLQRQFKADWCQKVRHLSFDFCLLQDRIIIELDGAQHFRQISNWSSPEENLKNDKFKEKSANENGFSIIRIIQEDVFNDAYDWVSEICQAIQKIQQESIVKNIYLCKNTEYLQFTS